MKVRPLIVVTFLPPKITNGVSRKVFHGDDYTFVEATLEKDSKVPDHSHKENQVTTVISGTLCFYKNGKRLILQEGQSVIVEPGINHSAIALTKCVVHDLFTPKRADI